MPAFRNRHFFMMDLVLLPAAAVIAFALRLDVTRVQGYAEHAFLFVLLAVPVKIVVLELFGLYSRYWRYASTDELFLITLATGISTTVVAALLFALILPLSGLAGFPRSIPFIDGLLTLLAIGGPRFLVRLAEQAAQRRRRRAGTAREQRVLVVGAGDAGAMIVKEMGANPQVGLVPVGFIDDDEGKRHIRIHGVPVLGGRERLPQAVRDYRVDEVIIAMPTAPGAAIRQVLAACGRASVPARTIPGLYDIIAGQVGVDAIRQVEIEDLLRREPVRTDTDAVTALLQGRCVLVTGAGGSIGSELCRQILRTGPARLVVLGHGETSIYRIYHELLAARGTYEGIEVVPAIADVRDRRRLAAVFGQYRPEIVFHAAAHKHVPLMERNVCEAITNNVLGTRNLVDVAREADVLDLVAISTDKAVNPTSIMGATKRVAELLVYQAARQTGRCYAAVRFGNVLGSRGSVVNRFKQQIAAGGPVTVTHPEMERYFMTIPEAVQLVLQAAALGEGGEVFVLDMGQPVRIVDLATDLIRLSGLRPRVAKTDGRADGGAEGDGADGDAGDWDIEVVFTGARPGEKLSEELFAAGEHRRPTRHDKILVALNGKETYTFLTAQIERLIDAAQAGREDEVRQLLGAIVPEYHPPALEPGDDGCDEPRWTPARPRLAEAGGAAIGAFPAAALEGAGD